MSNSLHAVGGPLTLPRNSVRLLALADRRRRRRARPRLDALAASPDGDAVYWSEARPAEDGRDVIVVRPRTGARDAIPHRLQRPHPRARVRRRRLHRPRRHRLLLPRRRPAHLRDARRRSRAPITPEPDVPFGLRYADLQVTPTTAAGRACASATASPSTSTTSCASRSAGGDPVASRGHDFYSVAARLPGRRPARLARVGSPADAVGGLRAVRAACSTRATLVNERRVAGGPAEAIVQPAWSPDSVLHYSSDRTGWWNLYRGSGTRR